MKESHYEIIGNFIIYNIDDNNLNQINLKTTFKIVEDI